MGIPCKCGDEWRVEVEIGALQRRGQAAVGPGPVGPINGRAQVSWNTLCMRTLACDSQGFQKLCDRQDNAIVLLI